MAAPFSQFSEGEVYVVQAEDWLGKIAEKFYNDATLDWFIIQATNAKATEDHTFTPLVTPFNNLEIGQKLWIPPREAAVPDPTPSAPILSQVAEIGMPADTLAFSPDDKLLALDGWQENGDRVIQVWETETWSLRWANDKAHYITFSPNGQQLATVISGTACLCEPTTGHSTIQLKYNETVHGVSFSSDGQRLVSASSGGNVILWDAATGQSLAEFKHDLPISEFILSPTGPWLVVVTSGSWGPIELVVWDIFTHERRTLVDLKELPNYSNTVFSPDTKWLAASVGFGAPITIWETQTWPEVAHLEGPPGIIEQIAFSPDGRWLAEVVSNGEIDHKIWIWEVPTWRVVAQMDQADAVFDIAFSPDSHWLAVGLGWGAKQPPAFEAQLWEVAGGKLVARMPHSQQVQAVAFSHAGQWLATGSVDRTVRLWAVP